MYKNKNLAPEQRALDLLSKMSLGEKIQQMLIYININKVYDDLKTNGGFEIRGGTFSTPKDIDTVNSIQEYCINNTRLGIPMLFAYESLHGLYDPKATVFPQCAGIGGSFNRELVAQMADVIGREASSIGIKQVYAPDLDVPRDPRWGRTQECFGEDPYLVGEMGVKYVKGVQKHAVATTAKHFIAYGVPEGGINLAPAHMGEREMREVTLEPFKKAIDAGVMSVMPAYNEIDGEPVHASKKYMRDLLRDELGFDGVTVSDYGAIDMLKNFHHITDTPLEAGRLALEAGVDIEAPYPFGYGKAFEEAVERGEIDIKLVDEAVLRILTLKFKLGLFDNPYIDEAMLENMHRSEAVELSRKLDEESILLLENDGILPLDESKINKVAVIGNNAKESFLGDYISQTKHCVDFYSGIKARLGEERILYSQGCNPITYTEQMIEDAVNTAKAADVVFLVLGDRASEGGGVGGAAGKKPEVTCGEGYDVHDLSLPPSQQRLFDEITSLGKPVVFVEYAGRPYALENDVKKVNAFLFSWGGGEQSGNAFANIIFGDVSPSAKLSVSFPKSVGHIPCYYNYKVSARGNFYFRRGTIDNPGRDYVLSSPHPWYPFGYGLSYTTIDYSDLTVENLENGNIKVCVTVENTGKYDKKESILLYLKALSSPVTPFAKKLRSFKKVELKKGEKKTVEFLLTDEDFMYVDLKYNTVKLTGNYRILVDKLQADITVK